MNNDNIVYITQNECYMNAKTAKIAIFATKGAKQIVGFVKNVHKSVCICYND